MALSTAARTCQTLGNEARCRHYAEILVAAAGEQAFPQYLALGKCMLGWLTARQGNVSDGLGTLAEAIAALHSLGSRRETAYVNGLMADALAWAGRQSEAMRLLDETLLVSARTGAAAFDARTRGRKATMLATGSGADVAAAEAEFKYAIDIARNQSSRLFELQSCIGLARLWLRQGKPAEARGLLEPVHAWFTEGMTLPDLREAREVLAL
jgi:predicted ATPase